MPSKAVPVVKVDKMTRKVVAEYPSCKEAERAEGMPRGCVRRACRDLSLPTGRYYLRTKEGFDPDEDFTGKYNCPVVLLDTWERRIRWYPSASECANAMHITPTTLCAVLTGRVNILMKRYAVKRMPVRFQPKGEE